MLDRLFALFHRRRPVKAELELSPAAFAELGQKLREAGIAYRVEGDILTVDGRIELALTCAEEAQPAPTHPAHRPIAPGVGTRRKAR